MSLQGRVIAVRELPAAESSGPGLVASGGSGRTLWASITTEWGVLSGAWSGPLRAEGEMVWIELSYDVQRWELRRGMESPLLYSPGDSQLVLAGRIQACDDEIVVLTIGTHIEMVELEETLSPGDWLSVEGDNLVLYDSNI